MEKKCWAADAPCRSDPSLAPHYDSEQDLGSPEALILRDEESSEEDRPCPPRFLLQEIIFAHEGVFHNQPSLQRNLLCRSDWLRLRGISETECMILPIRELAAFPRCSVCEQLKAEERSSARWPLSASALLDDSRWQSWSGGLGRADSPCSGRTGSICDSEPDFWKWDLDVAGDTCPRVPGPVPQPAVPFRPRLLLRESFSSLTSYPILAAPFAEVPSPNPIGSPAGEEGSHAPSVPSSCSRPLSTTDGGALI